jgi:hypothetical protein
MKGKDLFKAYVQPNTRDLAKKGKEFLRKNGFTSSIRANYNDISISIMSGPLDFISNYIDIYEKGYNHAFDPRNIDEVRKNIERSKYIQVNPYHYEDAFDGKCLKLLTDLYKILETNQSHHETGDYGAQPNYYIHVDIGQWNKPYLYKK